MPLAFTPRLLRRRKLTRKQYAASSAGLQAMQEDGRRMAGNCLTYWDKANQELWQEVITPPEAAEFCRCAAAFQSGVAREFEGQLKSVRRLEQEANE